MKQRKASGRLERKSSRFKGPVMEGAKRRGKMGDSGGLHSSLPINKSPCQWRETQISSCFILRTFQHRQQSNNFKQSIQSVYPALIGNIASKVTVRRQPRITHQSFLPQLGRELAWHYLQSALLSQNCRAPVGNRRTCSPEFSHHIPWILYTLDLNRLDW